jgi:hypothetical protein
MLFVLVTRLFALIVDGISGPVTLAYLGIEVLMGQCFSFGRLRRHNPSEFSPGALDGLSGLFFNYLLFRSVSFFSFDAGLADRPC